MLNIRTSKANLFKICLLLIAAQSTLTTLAQINDSILVTCTINSFTNDFLADTTIQHTSVSENFSYRQQADEKLDMPKVQLHPKAVKFVNTYLKDNLELLQKIKDKSAPYFKIIETQLRKNKLPLELKYLAVIESKLKAKAVSHAGAVGPWQLMPRTAKALGLKINSKHDERTHYYKSTVAVCKYIKQLYDIYDDWLLVLAAYNAGPGNVDKAIKQSGSKNFWHLQYYLPAETRAHVKRFIGAHYFFEQGGSELTLTKAETIAYRKRIEKFKERMDVYDREEGSEDCSLQ